MQVIKVDYLLLLKKNSFKTLFFYCVIYQHFCNQNCCNLHHRKIIVLKLVFHMLFYIFWYIFRKAAIGKLKIRLQKNMIFVIKFVSWQLMAIKTEYTVLLIEPLLIGWHQSFFPELSGNISKMYFKVREISKEKHVTVCFYHYKSFKKLQIWQTGSQSSKTIVKFRKIIYKWWSGIKFYLVESRKYFHFDWKIKVFFCIFLQQSKLFK